MARTQDSGPLLTDLLTVRSHGDWGNQSVGVVVPSDSRQVVGFGPDGAVQVHGWSDRIRLAPTGVSLPVGALTEHQRQPVTASGTLQVNIPVAVCDMLDIERGDRLRGYTHQSHIELLPIEDALDLGGEP